MSATNFTNPESLIYQNDLLQLTVLGGIKLDGLDRMRSTLKIELKESAVPPVRHNLDLYNDNQIEKLIRKSAEKLEIGTSILAASLAELTEQLEEYRLKQIKENQPKPYEPPKLTPEERKEAEEFLKETKLLERTNKLIGKSGVVGEEINRLLMYLIMTSRKQNRPLHIVSLGSSGTGKTHLQEKVGELIPEEDKLEITTLSENAFYYFGQRELQNKLILIEDLDGLSGASKQGGGAFYALRELQSKKRISKTIAHKNSKGETRRLHLVVEGPVSVAGCTTKESLYEDNANRSFLIYLDESETQDKGIMDYQRAVSAGQIDEAEEQAAAKLLRNCQRLLEPIKVVNPFAAYLQIPKAVFKPRRTNNHYLQFIEAITFYHQKQRQQKVYESTGEVFIETTIEDIKAANDLLKEILLRKSDELSGACRNYFEKLKQWSKENKEEAFTNRQARQALRVNGSNQKRYNLQLMAAGYLVKIKGKKNSGYTYRIADAAAYKKLQKQIETALSEALKKAEKEAKAACPEPVEGFSSSGRFTSPSEPPKSKKNSKVKSGGSSKSKKASAEE